MQLLIRISRFSPLIAIASYLLLSLIYIHPGEIYFFTGSTTQVLSDGTDPTTFPYQFSFLINEFLKDPTNLLFGAVYNPYLDYPQGQVMWIPMIERLQVLLFAPFVPVEQISTGLVILSMTLNAFFMYLLGRAFNLSNVTSFSMGIAWGFSAYTRARAKVHMGLVGIYHLPLLFLCLLLLKKHDRRSFILSSTGFLLISFMPHYYVVTLASLTPLILIFIWLQKSGRTYFFKVCLAAIPAILWLSWSLLKPLPFSISFKGSPYPTTGQTTEKYHPYLNHFKAEAIDFFTGDIGIGEVDINPIKEILHFKISNENFRGSNPHEKAQGIRWVLWLFGILGCAILFKKDKRIGFFMAFGLCSFWLSLDPSYGASLWLHKFVSQIRVPNRAGIGLAFSLILISGFFIQYLQQNLNPNRFNLKIISWAFLLLIIFELPPLINFMPISNIVPKFEELTSKLNCGVGTTYPVLKETQSNLVYYYLQQRLRNSNCKILSLKEVESLSSLNTPSLEQIQQEIKKLKLDWVILDQGLKCRQLNLRTLRSDDTICEF